MNKIAFQTESKNIASASTQTWHEIIWTNSVQKHAKDTYSKSLFDFILCMLKTYCLLVGDFSDIQIWTLNKTLIYCIS